MNSLKEINIKNLSYYFFDDMVNIKYLDPNKIKIDEGLYKNVLIYHIGQVTIKDLKINSVNPLYVIIIEINGLIEESNGNKYLRLVPTNGSKDTQKKYEELGTKSGILLL